MFVSVFYTGIARTCERDPMSACVRAMMYVFHYTLMNKLSDAFSCNWFVCEYRFARCAFFFNSVVERFESLKAFNNFPDIIIIIVVF